MMVERRFKSDPGFTLLEVMIAVAIIAIAVVTLLGAQSQSVSLVAGTKFDTTASLLAQWKMSDLLLQDFDQLADDQGNFGEDYPQFYWRVQVTELGERDTGLKGLDDRLKALDIEVISHDNERLRYALRTLVFKATPQQAEDNNGKDDSQEDKVGKSRATSTAPTGQNAADSESSEAGP